MKESDLMDSQNNLIMISEQIQSEYKQYRKDGYSRNDAILLIREEYNCELQDDEDRIAVLIGIVMALCKKNELFYQIADETREAIESAKYLYVHDKTINKYIEKIEEILNNRTVYGDEASYKQVTIYSPDWVVGDVFSHTLTYPTAEELGIMGWEILFLKVGEYVDEHKTKCQLMLVSLCPPDSVPSCYEDLKIIRFLPMMQLGKKFEYLVQMEIKSKRTENTYELTKIGCYPDFEPTTSDDYREENPLTAMPFFGRLKRTDTRPDYEDSVCRLYRSFRKMI